MSIIFQNTIKKIIEKEVEDFNSGNYDFRKRLENVILVVKTETENTIKKELSGAGLDNVKSGRKIAKKMRQTYQRELNSLARDRVDNLYKTFEEHIRPKPKFIPVFIWKTLQKIVLRHYI